LFCQQRASSNDLQQPFHLSLSLQAVDQWQELEGSLQKATPYFMLSMSAGCTFGGIQIFQQLRHIKGKWGMLHLTFRQLTLTTHKSHVS
jgi:hypothetical protein